MGGRGGNSGVGANRNAARAIQNIKTIDKLADYMLDKYDFSFYDDSLAKLDFEFVKAAAVEIAAIKEEFPQASQALRGIYVQSRSDGELALYNVYSRSIALSPSFIYGTAAATYSSQVRAGNAPEGGKMINIISHEMGHGLESALAQRNGTSLERHKEATRIVSNAAKVVKSSQGKDMKINDMVSQISSYATKNRSETLAEAVADYRANGARAKPLSRAIWAELKRELS